MEFELSAASAQAIVEEVGSLVHQNINLMDRSGRVIASMDAARIGSLHEGARRVICEGLPELYVRREDATASSRQGLNLPITVDGRIAGVIGITGPYEEVAGYGKIVKKMVEILIREQLSQKEARLRRRMRALFLEDWILGNGLMQPQSLAERGYSLGIDIWSPRRVMVMGPADQETFSPDPPGHKTLEQMEETARLRALELESGCLVLSNAGRQICLIPDREEKEPGYTEKFAGAVWEAVREQTGRELAIGIDGGLRDIPSAFLQANKAWRSARAAGPGGRILTYDEVTLELLTEDLPDHIKSAYLEKIFKQCSPGELRQWMGLLEVWFQAEGSLQEAAARLHIHKNTLTYKLNRLEELTGHDVRKPSRSALFYMALICFRDLERI